MTPASTVALLDAVPDPLRGLAALGSSDVSARDGDCKPAVRDPERAMRIAT